MIAVDRSDTTLGSNRSVEKRKEKTRRINYPTKLPEYTMVDCNHDNDSRLTRIDQ